jgi:hypothetical protein
MVIFHPWPDLLKRPRRELLVHEVLFTTGITTLTGPSGEGKTTLAIAIALTVATGGIFAGKQVKPRPVLWIAGEGQDDLPGMYQAWMQEHPSCGVPEGGFVEEAFDFSSDAKTDALIQRLKESPPMLIVIDALVDMMGDLDEDKAKDIHRVYANLWRVVRANNSTVLVLHHTGWDRSRERGSSALRPENDILVHITAFDAVKGEMKLTHHKRRGGAKLKEFIYEVKLIPVAGYPQPIPLVTGVLKAGGLDLNRPFKRSRNAQAGFDVLGIQFPRGAEWNEWFVAWGRKQKETGEASSKATFNRVIQELSIGGNSSDVLKEGEGEGAIWRVNPTTWEREKGEQSHKTGLTEPVSSQVPIEGLETAETGSGSPKPVSNRSHETGSIEGRNEQNSVANGSDSDWQRPPNLNPEEAERYRAIWEYENQLSREQTARATGQPTSDLVGEAMEQLGKRKEG